MEYNENEYRDFDTAYGNKMLSVIGLNVNDFDRYRFTWYEEEDNEIVVSTRCGGDNRDFEDWKIIRENPYYTTDYDDSGDSTYAYIVFSPNIDDANKLKEINAYYAKHFKNNSFIANSYYSELENKEIDTQIAKIKEYFNNEAVKGYELIKNDKDLFGAIVWYGKDITGNELFTIYDKNLKALDGAYDMFPYPSHNEITYCDDYIHQEMKEMAEIIVKNLNNKTGYWHSVFQEFLD